MGHFSCVIQDGGSAQAATGDLEARLAQLHASRYGDEPVTVSWRAVPQGYMFTEGRQSTSSIIACVLEHETNLVEREAFMRGVCDIWTEVTGCTDHEIVVAITDIERAPALIKEMEEVVEKVGMSPFKF